MALSEGFPKAAVVMNEERQEVLTCRHLPESRLDKSLEVQELERVNEKIKLSTASRESSPTMRRSPTTWVRY